MCFCSARFYEKVSVRRAKHQKHGTAVGSGTRSAPHTHLVIVIVISRFIRGPQNNNDLSICVCSRTSTGFKKCGSISKLIVCAQKHDFYGTALVPHSFRMSWSGETYDNKGRNGSAASFRVTCRCSSSQSHTIEVVANLIGDFPWRGGWC